MSLRQQAEQLARPSRHDRSQTLMPQRGQRDRQCVVGVVLVRSTVAQQTCPCRQRCRHVDDVLVGGNGLLSEQEPESLGSLDRPSSRCERLRPGQQPTELVAAAAHLQPSDLDLAAADSHRSVRCLVRIDTDDHVHEVPPVLLVGIAMGTPTCGSCARSSLEPHHDQDPDRAALRSKARPRRGRQALREQLDRDPPTLRNQPQRQRQSQVGASRTRWTALHRAISGAGTRIRSRASTPPDSTVRRRPSTPWYGPRAVSRRSGLRMSPAWP